MPACMRVHSECNQSAHARRVNKSGTRIEDTPIHYSSLFDRCNAVLINPRDNSPDRDTRGSTQLTSNIFLQFQQVPHTSTFCAPCTHRGEFLLFQICFEVQHSDSLKTGALYYSYGGVCKGLFTSFF